MNSTCLLVRVQGAVQGVGFRPFVYRMAIECHCTGDVRNCASGVEIRAFGSREALACFLDRIRDNPPPLAVVRSLSSEFRPCAQDIPNTFSILQSDRGEKIDVDAARDVAVCEACLREMMDPGDRRYLHPFINCTDCGPRFTILRSLPYDRPVTSMASFPMCQDCEKEYRDPACRRFHAQPICCHQCGPHFELLDPSGALQSEDPIRDGVALLNAGRIVAVKGIGGFHLACRSDLSQVIQRLRDAKFREEKPFALMARDVEAVAEIALMREAERAALQGPERPIVLLDKKDTSAIAQEVSPQLRTVGILLPYAPIHHLLFMLGGFDFLVMTSANRTDEPILTDNREAIQVLGGVVDAFLVHDRAILVRNDDSIVRAISGHPAVLRRARGFVPEPVSVGVDAEGIVGCGASLKSAIGVGRGRMAYLSPHIGDVENLASYQNLQFMIQHLSSLLGVRPNLYACDVHPEYLSTRVAERSGLPVQRVQHHHAHAAACMAENDITGPAVCVVYDGTGYGTDGTVWGGEILVADRRDFRRAGRLGLMPMPGGEAAIRHPGRMAVAALASRMGEKVSELLPWMKEEEVAAVLSVLSLPGHAPLTSSMGRLFDAASALIDTCRIRTYEGQPAVALEGISSPGERGEYPVRIREAQDLMEWEGAEALQSLAEDLRAGTPKSVVAARFHNTVAAATAVMAQRTAEETGVPSVCLCGGCFQNALLSERLGERLQRAGLSPVLHRILPPNDGAIAYGQIVVAAARREST